MSLTVTHFAPDLAPAAGGPVTALDNMARCQVSAGLEVRIASGPLLTADPGFVADVSEGKTREAELPQAARTAMGPGERERIDRLVAQSDVCHIHGVWEPLQRAVARSAKRQDRVLFWTPHGLLTRWAMGRGRLKKSVYLAACFRPQLPKRCVQHFASEAERESTTGLGRVGRAQVVPMGIDTDRFGRVDDTDYLSRQHGSEGPTVLFVGRVHPGKGVEHLVAAAKRMDAAACTFVIAGPNTSEWAQGLMRDAEKVEPRYVFTGALPLEEVARALTSATVYCLPSDHENFGMAAAEAMAAGAACLLSREVAIAGEAAKAGAAAICRRDPAGLAADLNDLLNAAERRHALAAAAKAHARTCYDLAVTAEAWKAAYHAAL